MVNRGLIVKRHRIVCKSYFTLQFFKMTPKGRRKQTDIYILLFLKGKTLDGFEQKFSDKVPPSSFPVKCSRLYRFFLHFDFIRDAIGLVCMDTFTSSLAGFVIFSVLGYMSKQIGIDIEKVVQSGKSNEFVNLLAMYLPSRKKTC